MRGGGGGWGWETARDGRLQGGRLPERPGGCVGGCVGGWARAGLCSGSRALGTPRWKGARKFLGAEGCRFCIRKEKFLPKQLGGLSRPVGTAGESWEKLYRGRLFLSGPSGYIEL